jgi:hypothetical protein
MDINKIHFRSGQIILFFIKEGILKGWISNTWNGFKEEMENIPQDLIHKQGKRTKLAIRIFISRKLTRYELKAVPRENAPYVFDICS